MPCCCESIDDCEGNQQLPCITSLCLGFCLPVELYTSALIISALTYRRQHFRFRFELDYSTPIDFVQIPGWQKEKDQPDNSRTRISGIVNTRTVFRLSMLGFSPLSAVLSTSVADIHSSEAFLRISHCRLYIISPPAWPLA